MLSGPDMGSTGEGQRDFLAEAARLAVQIGPSAWNFDELGDDRTHEMEAPPLQPWQYETDVALASQVSHTQVNGS